MRPALILAAVLAVTAGLAAYAATHAALYAQDAYDYGDPDE